MKLTRSEVIQLFALCLLSDKDRLAIDADRYGHLKSLVEQVIKEPKERLRLLLSDEGVTWDGTSKILPFLAENLAVEATARHDAELLQKSMSYLAIAARVPNIRNDQTVMGEVLKASKTLVELIEKAQSKTSD